ncbi:unnamed protein product [Periconia digitata]|uniref:Uncharacterized protein n=1 Tax=Periconia digitata TaxID=1303443 RepID=A0A9W4XFT0_9PLEO|nr:unnamed protein product [Periconia digitata]
MYRCNSIQLVKLPSGGDKISPVGQSATSQQRPPWAPSLHPSFSKQRIFNKNIACWSPSFASLQLLPLVRGALLLFLVVQYLPHPSHPRTGGCWVIGVTRPSSVLVPNRFTLPSCLAYRLTADYYRKARRVLFQPVTRCTHSSILDASVGRSSGFAYDTALYIHMYLSP